MCDRIKPGWGFWRRRAALLLLPVLLLGGLIPRGYMPDVDALRDGRLTLTLCRVAATADAADITGDDAGPAALLAQDQPCPFSLLPVWVGPPAPPALPQRVAWPVPAPAPAPIPLVRVAAAAGGLGPRGPPAV